MKTGCPFVVERAEAFEGPATGRLECDVLANHIVYASSVPNGGDVFIADPSSHICSLGQSLVPFDDTHISQTGYLIHYGS